MAAYPALSIRGVDLGRVDQRIQNHKRNALAMEEAEAARDRRNALSSGAQEMMGGNALGGFKKMAGADPMAAVKFREQWQKMDNASREQAMQDVQFFDKVFGDIATPNDYQTARSYAISMRPDLADKIPERYDPNWLNARKFGAELVKDASKYGQPKAGVDAEGNPVYFQASDSGDVRTVEGVRPTPDKGGTQLANLLAERDALPEGDPRRQFYDQKIAKMTAPSNGVSLTYDAEGRPIVRVGGAPNQIENTKSTVNKIQDKEIQVTDMMARIRDIEQSFNPEYLTWDNRVGFTFDALKEKTGLFDDISPENRQELRDYTIFRRRSINNINKLLNELSGAAVSPAEAVRLRNSMPDAGDGLFDGDSPTEFKAKLDDVTRELRMAAARYAYAQRNGITGTAEELANAMPLDEVPKLIDQRGEQLERQMQAKFPDASEDMIEMEVQARLSSEFGLGF